MIIQVPAINGLNMTKGCELAPKRICDDLGLESKSLALDNTNIEEQQKKIYRKAYEFLLHQKKTGTIIFIGGDHSISFPIGQAFLEIAKNPGLLIFDAHPDLMKPLQNPSHEEWLRALIEDKKFNEILLVGIRKNSLNIDKREIEFAKGRSIKIIYADEVSKKQEEILNFCQDKNIYLSLDIDVFDKSLINSTGYPENNGLGLELIGLIKKIKNVCIFDLVEVNPQIGDFSKALKVIRKILWKR